MLWTKVLSVLGIAIELGGFYVLARELLRTNADVVAYAKMLGSETTTADTIVVSAPDFPGERGSISFTGGQVGSLGPAAAKLAAQVIEGARMTWLGLGLTAAGVVFQFFGTLFGN